jgi:pilus assembly protein CpaC
MAVSPNTTLYFGLPRAQMELFLQAMAENSLVKVLAEPNLVAISGQQAEFLAGGELPIPTPNENGIAITFREFGIRLRFQPVVQAGEMIRLNVMSEVSEPDFTNAVQISGFTVPGIHTRRAQTVVEVGSGQTFAIAGLLSESVRGIATRVPGAGDIPVLGALFRSVRYEKAETELVILITPDLASPLNPNEVTYIPGQDLNSPNDWQLYGLGLLQDNTKKCDPAAKEPAQPSFAPPAPLCGPWGVQMPQSNAAN